LIQELFYADDSVFFASPEADLQAITSSFASAAERFCLTINVSKTEILYQPAPGAPSESVKIIVDGVEVKQTNEFCYEGSVLSSNAVINGEIQCCCCIQEAAASFGLRLRRSVCGSVMHGITTAVKVNVYTAAVLTILPYGGENWTLYLRHIKQLEAFRARCLRKILNVHWQDKILNSLPRYSDVLTAFVSKPC